MTEKRFTVHIKWFNYEKTEGEIELFDNGQPLLLSESVEDVQWIKSLLNDLHEENITLKLELSFSQNQNRELRKVLKDNRSMAEVVEENKKLKRENELLSDELEQCKAVINKKWSEYLKKKME